MLKHLADVPLSLSMAPTNHTSDHMGVSVAVGLQYIVYMDATHTSGGIP